MFVCFAKEYFVYISMSIIQQYWTNTGYVYMQFREVILLFSWYFNALEGKANIFTSFKPFL